MYLYIIFLVNIRLVAGEMDGFVVGGDYIDINSYPHSNMMYINCTTTYLCGGSFINNRVVLTAAHCLYPCVDPANDILILNYGHAAIDKMKHLKVRRFLVHYKYSDISLENDIGLIYSNAPVKFGKSVKRVALLSIFPRRATHGYVTGWGLVNRDPEELATSMKYVHQDIIRPKECRRGNVPAGIFCGQSKNVEEYPEMGDSGGAFVVYKYIQIGIVSFMLPKNNIVAYTNTTYHYRWIKTNTLQLLCR